MRMWCVLFSAAVAIAAPAANLARSDDGTGLSSHVLGKDPTPFLWGVATAAYQIEGSVDAEGRGPSIWDTFAHMPGKISNNDNGDVADDSYRQFREDVQSIKKMGLNAYRFSISWSRILPQGSLRGGINYLAIRHYNRLVDELLDSGIQPLVTLYHWDLPAALEEAYGGWLSPEVERDFSDYVDICFSNFGDRVKFWITLNEPWTYSLMGYGMGSFAPGRCSDRRKCQHGNSSTEPYIVAHNSLNAHAAAVELYRLKYQSQQGGKIGITLNHDWAEPLTDNPADRAAAERRNEFAMGWFADPLFFGRYPDSMVQLVGARLPAFTTSQRKRIKGSYDFLGLNHYSSKYYSSAAAPNEGSWSGDQANAETKFSSSGLIIGPQAASPWLNVVPWGFYNVLQWSSRRYTLDGKRPVIIVTENGCDAPGENEKPLPDVLHDTFRIKYYEQYLAQMERAIRDGVDIRGFMAWSLNDNFEWADGYGFRFGLTYVDYHDPLRTRYPKSSSVWYAQYTRNHSRSVDQPNSAVNDVDEAGNSAHPYPSTWVDFLFRALEISPTGLSLSEMV